MLTSGSVIAAILVGLVLYQLVSGKLLNAAWKAWTTRQERPFIYWSCLLFEALVAAGMVYLTIRDLRQP